MLSRGSRTAAAFWLHLENGFNEFLAGSFWAGVAPMLWRKEYAVFSILQCVVEFQERRRFSKRWRNGLGELGGEERTRTRDDTIGCAQIR